MAAGHIASLGKKQREMDAGTQFTVSFLLPGAVSPGMALSEFRVSFLTLISLIWKLS